MTNSDENLENELHQEWRKRSRLRRQIFARQTVLKSMKKFITETRNGGFDFYLATKKPKLGKKKSNTSTKLTYTSWCIKNNRKPFWEK